MGSAFVLVLTVLALSHAAPENRIMGGDLARAGEFPWMVSIRDFVDTSVAHRCGGTIIDSTHVVTGARCCQRFAAIYHIVAGDINRAIPNADEQHVEVATKTVHENYNEATLENDICLLRVNPPFIFNGFVSAAELPPPDYDFNNNTDIVSAQGFGDREEGGIVSDLLLRSVALPIVDNEECNEIYNGTIIGTIDDTVFCAGGLPEGGVDTCDKDDGGPMTVKGTSTWVGVISFGNGCGRPGFPRVATRVTEYLGWLENNIGMGL